MLLPLCNLCSLTEICHQVSQRDALPYCPHWCEWDMIDWMPLHPLTYTPSLNQLPSNAGLTFDICGNFYICFGIVEELKNRVFSEIH